MSPRKLPMPARVVFVCAATWIALQGAAQSGQSATTVPASGNGTPHLSPASGPVEEARTPQRPPVPPALLASQSAQEPPHAESGRAGKTGAENPPALIPLPRKLSREPGSRVCGKSSRIVATLPELEPLARVLAEEILLKTGVSLATASGPPGPADIALRITPGGSEEGYVLETTGTVSLSGGSYPAVASATATLLQLVSVDNGALSIPRVTIEDEPSYAYRGALIDLARKYHTPGSIEQVIELCRFYKIRHLHLHLTDDQLFMFPSAKFPQLGGSNRELARFEPDSGRHISPYTRQELEGLERFARERGVCLVPELDLPGHSGRQITDARSIFGTPENSSTVNIASEKTCAALAELLNEVMDVFASTPYIHLGADEVGLGGLEKTDAYRDAQARFGIRSVHELYCKFISDLCRVVAQRGKRPIVWEEAWNPGGSYPLPKDAIVMVWSRVKSPADMVKTGYEVINATWTPLYIVRDNRTSLEALFAWSPPYFGREGSNQYAQLRETGLLKGAQLCSWENSESMEIQSLRHRLALVAERAWNAGAGGHFTDFKSRLDPLDAALEKLLHPVRVETNGAFADGENTFTEAFFLSLKPHQTGLTLKYTLDNSLPSERWQTYSGPIRVDKTVYLRAGLFDSSGRQSGRLVGRWFRSQIPAKPNLSTGKPVTVGPSPDRTDRWSARNAVDGRRDDPGGHWASEGTAPQWIQVDLEQARPINFINLVTFWDGGRYYQWTAEVSVDGTNWTRVLDFSANTIPATEAGHAGVFPTTEARFVRVHLLKNSANPFVHVVELIVDQKNR